MASKWMESMVEKHGSHEAVKAYMGSLGRKGGASGTTGGFGSKYRGKDGLTGKERAKVARKKSRGRKKI